MSTTPSAPATNALQQLLDKINNGAIAMNKKIEERNTAKIAKFKEMEKDLEDLMEHLSLKDILLKHLETVVGEQTKKIQELQNSRPDNVAIQGTKIEVLPDSK